MNDYESLEEKKKKKQQKGRKRAKKVASRAKKKSGKKDACYHKVKARYDVWPSAYASGALVKCRKVGADNWGNSTKESLSEMIQDEISKEELLALVQDAKTNPESLQKLESLIKRISLSYLDLDYEEVDEAKKKRKKKKAGTESRKESSLHFWFSRKGEKGPKGGWVDCNTCRKNKKTGRKTCKACGRSDGDKRSKYPSCRPTPGACKEKGRGKSWGKKSSKQNENQENTMNKEVIKEVAKKVLISELQKKYFKPGLLEHVKTKTPLHENIYRIGSECYFNTIKEGRKFYKKGLYQPINEEEREMLENTELGEWAMFEGEMVPLDFPMYEESIDEAEYKGKKVKLGDPTTGDVKKYKVFVRSKKGNVKKINYGDKKGGLKGNWNDPEARASFAARMDCENKKDRTTAGYWACRAHKDFGKNVPGRFW